MKYRVLNIAVLTIFFFTTSGIIADMSVSLIQKKGQFVSLNFVPLLIIISFNIRNKEKNASNIVVSIPTSK